MPQPVAGWWQLPNDGNVPLHVATGSACGPWFVSDTECGTSGRVGSKWGRTFGCFACSSKAEPGGRDEDQVEYDERAVNTQSLPVLPCWSMTEPPVTMRPSSSTRTAAARTVPAAQHACATRRHPDRGSTEVVATSHAWVGDLASTWSASGHCSTASSSSRIVRNLGGKPEEINERDQRERAAG